VPPHEGPALDERSEGCLSDLAPLPVFADTALSPRARLLYLALYLHGVDVQEETERPALATLEGWTRLLTWQILEAFEDLRRLGWLTSSADRQALTLRLAPRAPVAEPEAAGASEEPVRGRDDFLILSLKHVTGTVCRWWGPDNRGYVDRLDEAGHYTAASVAAKPGDYYDDGHATCTVPAEMAEAYSRGGVVNARHLGALRAKKPRGAEVLEATQRCLREGDVLGAELRLVVLLQHAQRARARGSR
jgi:hypothetical protein